MTSNSVTVPLALVATLAVLILALIGLGFQQGQIKAEVENNGERLVRIERLLDDQRSVQR